MFDNAENLKLLSSFKGISKASSRTSVRKNNSFIFRISGTASYIFADQTITTNDGDMIFIPKGSAYGFQTDPKNECRYTSINFEANLTDPKPALYSLENFSEANYICNHFSDLWNFGNQSEKYKCISLFYSLLSYISNIEHLDYSDKKKFKIIEPAVNYLKANIFDCSLKADKLHLMCGVSDTYFRKIFISHFGTSPQKYIVSKRILQAKSIIDSGDFETVREVASSVGYNDPLYFSRVFRKKYGVSPSNINKEV